MNDHSTDRVLKKVSSGTIADPRKILTHRFIGRKIETTERDLGDVSEKASTVNEEMGHPVRPRNSIALNARHLGGRRNEERGLKIQQSSIPVVEGFYSWDVCRRAPIRRLVPTTSSAYYILRTTRLIDCAVPECHSFM